MYARKEGRPLLTMLQGLPASGKSTYAKKLVARRVNKDDLRAMLDQGVYDPAFEDHIRMVEQGIVLYYLAAGDDVVVDDTNLKERDVTLWRNTAAYCLADFQIQVIDTPVEECIRRDAIRKEHVGETRIRQMAESWQKASATVA